MINIESAEHFDLQTGWQAPLAAMRTLATKTQPRFKNFIASQSALSVRTVQVSRSNAFTDDARFLENVRPKFELWRRPGKRRGTI